MKNTIAIMAAAACALALTACGGGSSRADEGIWSDFSDAAAVGMMQAVILSDGSFWGIAGQDFGPSATPSGPFCPNGGILHGTASVNGNSVSGSYVYFLTDSRTYSETYSGTVSRQVSLNLTFNGSSNPILSVGGSSSFNLSYDPIYNQPASLSAIAGNYLPDPEMSCPDPGGPGTPVGSKPNPTARYIFPSLTISGSNLTLTDQNGNVMMVGTIAPHGTTVNVFDISLTTATTVAAYSVVGLFSSDDVPAGTVYHGILFQTSSGILKNDVQIVAAAGNSAYFYAGNK